MKEFSQYSLLFISLSTFSAYSSISPHQFRAPDTAERRLNTLKELERRYGAQTPSYRTACIYALWWLTDRQRACYTPDILHNIAQFGCDISEYTCIPIYTPTKGRLQGIIRVPLRQEKNGEPMHEVTPLDIARAIYGSNTVFAPQLVIPQRPNLDHTSPKKRKNTAPVGFIPKTKFHMVNLANNATYRVRSSSTTVPRQINFEDGRCDNCTTYCDKLQESMPLCDDRPFRPEVSVPCEGPPLPPSPTSSSKVQQLSNFKSLVVIASGSLNPEG